MSNIIIIFLTILELEFLNALFFIFFLIETFNIILMLNIYRSFIENFFNFN